MGAVMAMLVLQGLSLRTWRRRLYGAGLCVQLSVTSALALKAVWPQHGSEPAAPGACRCLRPRPWAAGPLESAEHSQGLCVVVSAGQGGGVLQAPHCLLWVLGEAEVLHRVRR